MAHATTQNTWKDLLWNVSLLPTVTVSGSVGPPSGPGPADGNALGHPALLSVSEGAVRALPRAA
jgi:hypothetical protein